LSSSVCCMLRVSIMVTVGHLQLVLRNVTEKCPFDASDAQELHFLMRANETAAAAF
jgi:hypothetical protein